MIDVKFFIATQWSRARCNSHLIAASAVAVMATGCGGNPLPDDSLEATEVESALTPATYETWWGGSFYGSHGTMLADVDGDKKADLVGLGDGYVGVIRSNGSSFGSYETWWGGSFFGSHGTLLGNVDGDAGGKADLVGLGDGYIGVIRSNGSGFGSYETWLIGNFYGSHGTFLGDIDGDGTADLVGAGDGYVGVLRSTGSGFYPYETWRSGSFYGYRATLLGDVDGDRKADLVAVSDSGVSVIRSTGTTFGAFETWASGTFYGTKGTLLEDMTGDGKADLVILGDNTVKVSASTGTGFGPAETWFNGGFYGSHGTVAADTTGDGAADLVGMGDGYVGALVSPGLKSFGYQAMADRLLGRKLPGVPSSYSLRTLLIIAKFNTPAGWVDTNGDGTYDTNAPCTPVDGLGANQLTHPDAYYRNLVFGPTAPNVNGWFQTMSGGIMSLSEAGTVVLNNVPGDWGTDNPVVLAGLIQRASAQGFNFAAYDANGDGVVNTSELNIVVASNFHGWCATGGRGSMGANRYVGVAVNGINYQGNVAGLEENINFEIATHEMSHSLGAIDMYDAWMYGAMSVMGTSNSGINGTAEFGLDSWHKFTLGLVTPSRIIDLRVTPTIDVTLDGPVLVYNSSRGRSEYTLLENRISGTYQRNTWVGVMAWPVFQDAAGNPTWQMRSMPSLLGKNGEAAVQVKWMNGGANAFTYRVLDANGTVRITAN